MNRPASWLLDAYVLATWPLRRRKQAELARCGRAPACILFYHRVADDSPNGWTIGNDQFIRQVTWLRERFEIAALPEVQRRLRDGNSRPIVSLTFDDGYADNCTRAIPWLLAERIPFTYFVTLDNLVSGRPFPHDVAAGMPLAPNTPEQLRELAAAGVEIGAHTRTHPDLGRVRERSVLLDEVVRVREELARLIGGHVRYFAFPFGLHANLNAEAFRLAKQAGYAGVCSAYGGYNFPGDDGFHLQRIHGDPEWSRLRNWVTLDPRRLAVPRFEYATGAGA